MIEADIPVLNRNTFVCSSIFDKMFHKLIFIGHCFHIKFLPDRKSLDELSRSQMSVGDEENTSLHFSPKRRRSARVLFTTVLFESRLVLKFIP